MRRKNSNTRRQTRTHVAWEDSWESGVLKRHRPAELRTHSLQRRQFSLTSVLKMHCADLGWTVSFLYQPQQDFYIMHKQRTPFSNPGYWHDKPSKQSNSATKSVKKSEWLNCYLIQFYQPEIEWEFLIYSIPNSFPPFELFCTEKLWTVRPKW